MIGLRTFTNKTLKTNLKTKTMKIETTFSIGDTIHFLNKENKAVSEKIVRIDTVTSAIINPDLHEMTVEYWVRLNDKFEIVDSLKAFNSQASLIKSIIE